MTTILLFLFYFFTPILILYLCHKSTILKKIGSIVVAYIIGIVAGNIGIFPKASEAFKAVLANKASIPQSDAFDLFQQGVIRHSDLLVNNISATQNLIMTIVVPLSIPLLLFSLDLKNSFKNIKKGLFSMIVAMISLIICAFIGFFLFRNSIPESWKVGGMLVGLYTGGTPNLVALATALKVQPNTFILTSTYDMVVCSFLLLFCITYAQRAFNYVLPHYTPNKKPQKPAELINQSEAPDNILDNLSKKNIVPLLGALGIAVLIFGAAGAISLIVPSEFQMLTVILTITTLALLVSLIPKVNKINKTFELGMYFVLVFSLAVSSMADLRTIFQIQFLDLFLYVVIVVFGSMIVHVLLSIIFRIDTDTTIITITVLSFSPPFVPLVAGALKNKEVILMGITLGVIGYAAGNYIGVFFAYLFKGF
jgi:uncharacterized membrane protein